MNEVWESLGFFTARLRALAVSESIPLGEKGYCVSTGTDSENWVYLPERVTPEAAHDVMSFARERGEAFMWMVYDGGTESLDEAGLSRRGEYAAMKLDPAGAALRWNDSITVERVSRESAEEWASAAWSCFGGEGGVPEDYCEFVRAMVDDAESLSLYLAKFEGKTAGCFVLTNEPERVGVYYFATLPEFRRKGVASAMMSEICRLSGGRKIVLQSTSMGLKFYRAFGFEELFKIAVYSTEKDIL